MLPSKDALKAISIKKDIREDVANKSDRFCADTKLTKLAFIDCEAMIRL